MEKWIMKNLTLEGNGIRLSSLQSEHIPGLWQLAKDERIWEHYIYHCSVENRFKSLFNKALESMDSGREHCFVIQNHQGHLLGSTRFLDLNPEFKKLEIGWTWLTPECWGSGANDTCKWLLLKHCFEELRTIRVQLKTDELNGRSRKAILKIGAKFEGVLRNDMIREDGSFRNSAYYSITEAEWPGVKEGLRQKVLNQVTD